MNDNVRPFLDRNGLFTDMRVLARDMLNQGAFSSRGVIVLINDDGTIAPLYCGVDNRDLALIANYIAKDVT